MHGLPEAAARSGLTGERPEALILVIAASGLATDQVRSFAHQWQDSVPRAEFAGMEAEVRHGRTDHDQLGRRASEAASVCSRNPSQIVAVGSGQAGRIALDLVLQGLLPGAGVLGLYIPLWPPSSWIPSRWVMVRLVQHRSADDPGSRRFLGLIGALQGQGIDVRGMILPEAAGTSPETTFRAGAAYLVELVARASRIPTVRGALP